MPACIWASRSPTNLVEEEVDDICVILGQRRVEPRRPLLAHQPQLLAKLLTLSRGRRRRRRCRSAWPTAAGTASGRRCSARPSPLWSGWSAPAGSPGPQLLLRAAGGAQAAVVLLQWPAARIRHLLAREMHFERPGALVKALLAMPINALRRLSTPAAGQPNRPESALITRSKARAPRESPPVSRKRPRPARAAAASAGC